MSQSAPRLWPARIAATQGPYSINAMPSNASGRRRAAEMSRWGQVEQLCWYEDVNIGLAADHPSVKTVALGVSK